jgi:transposase
VRVGTQARNRIHAVVADFGDDRAGTYWTGPGRGWLAELDLPPVSRLIVTGCLAISDALEVVIGQLDVQVRARAKADPRVKALTALPGVGQFTALVMLAEIGDITRFASARKLASWAGLTPTVRGSDRTVRHGHISKQGPVWLRWVLNQAAQTAKRSPQFEATYAAAMSRLLLVAGTRSYVDCRWHHLAARRVRRRVPVRYPRMWHRCGNRHVAAGTGRFWPNMASQLQRSPGRFCLRRGRVGWRGGRGTLCALA